MSVVNCKVKFIRPQYNNLKEWMDDDANFYIGRAGVVFITNDETGKKERFPKLQSVFANPFKVGKDGTREEVIQKYKKYMSDKVESDYVLRQVLLELDGKNLGCWCHPEPCHGDVLLELIQKYKNMYFCDYCEKCDPDKDIWSCDNCDHLLCEDCLYNDDLDNEALCCCEDPSFGQKVYKKNCYHESSTKPTATSSYSICDYCGEEIEL